MSSKNSKRATGEIEDPLLQTELISASVDENSDLSVQEKPASNKQLLVVIYSVMLLISAVGNSVFNKKMTNHMKNYPYFLTQFTTLVYIPIFGSIVAWTLQFTDFITPEQRVFPKYKFLIMGAFDSLSGVFTLFGGVYTSGNTQGLLFQAVVPVTMILSYFVLKQRYRMLQILGAAIIMGGVITVILPKFLNGNSNGEDRPLFNIIFLISVIPMALSTIYKEIAFNDVELDVNYLQFWVAAWQLLVGFVLLPLNTLSFLGPSAMPWDQLPSALGNGFRCLGGINSVVTNCCVGAACDTSSLAPCDICEGAWVPVIFYLMFNCAYNVFIVLVVKHGSAALLYIIMTLRLPIVNIAFSLQFIEDPPEVVSKYTWIGLGLIIVGLVSYRFGSMQPSDAEARPLATRGDEMESEE